MIAHQGEKDKRITKKVKLKLKPGKKATKKLKLNDRGRRWVQSCIDTKLEGVRDVEGGQGRGGAQEAEARPDDLRRVDTGRGRRRHRRPL